MDNAIQEKVSARRTNRGRKTALTPEVQRIILSALSVGAQLKVAGRAAGVSDKTILDWIARGEGRSERASDPVFVEFVEELKKAKAKQEVHCLDVINKASLGQFVVTTVKTIRKDGTIAETTKYAPPHWPAAAWLLERKYPDRYGRRDRMEMSSLNGGPIRLELTKALEELEQEMGKFP